MLTHTPYCAQASFVPAEWEVDGLDAEAREQLMGGTAQRLFGF